MFPYVKEHFTFFIAPGCYSTSSKGVMVFSGILMKLIFSKESQMHKCLVFARRMFTRTCGASI